MTKSKPSVKELDERLLAMLREGRREFDIAADVLLSGGDPSAVREDVYRTDQGINQMERELRRRLVVHGVVHGIAALPGSLVLMSLVKDAERIGDYAKNIFELASLGVRFDDDARRRELVKRKTEISEFLGSVIAVMARPDEARARALLEEASEISAQCNAEGVRLIRDVQDRNPSGEVLLLRYLKRVVSHARNVASSVVVPVDQLDFRPGAPESEA